MIDTAPEIAVGNVLDTFLPPGRYGHVGLKRAYFAACSALVGRQFREELHARAALGQIIMTRAICHGEEVDFFTAVVSARHDAHPVPGCCEVLATLSEE